MLYLSKSKYCGLWQCPKIAWLQKYKPEVCTQDSAALSRMETGNEVGDLAMSLFGDYIEVTAYDGDTLDLPAMLRRTVEELEKNTPVICEASFEYNGLYCAVDILKAEDGGYALYEVKSSTHDDKGVYLADIAYQCYVLSHCGVTVTHAYLITVNSDYVFDGTLDLTRFFRITEVSDRIEAEAVNIEDTIRKAEALLTSDEEPSIPLHEGCNAPYPCSFWSYCTRELPSPSVFDLYRLPFSKKLNFYRKGQVSFEQLAGEKTVKNDKQLRQIQHHLQELPPHIDKEGLRRFLSTLSFPLYFLDFETVQPVIPRYIGTKPFAQIPFQYSLHYIEEAGGELKHKEFLAEADTDPRRAVAERLCEDIPKDVCVTAYNKAFECTRLKELAAQFPDLAEHLLNIEQNIRDLLTPFQNGCYYNRAMGGSFSIKSVLPALFPDDPSLDYHNLTGVHNGSEAMALFPRLGSLSESEQAVARDQLLRYCELDTFAMVKVWDAVCRAAE